MTTKHTPGPWFVDKDGNIVTENGDEVFASHGFDGDGHYMAATHADRILAAAAPDLLAACERALMLMSPASCGGRVANVDSLIAEIGNAVDKAKGNIP